MLNRWNFLKTGFYEGIKVVKLASHDRTITSVEILADETRVMELSQMLGSDSGVTRSNALEMLEQAVRWKESGGKVTQYSLE